MQTFLNVVLIILVIALIALAVLYYFGRKMEKRQAEAAVHDGSCKTDGFNSRY